LKISIIWGLGIGDWGLGIGDWAQSPIPNPQSPIPINLNLINFIFHYFNIFYYKIKLNFIITINNFNQEPVYNNLLFSLFFLFI